MPFGIITNSNTFVPYQNEEIIYNDVEQGEGIMYKDVTKFQK
jgi:hypothetical protein